MEAGYNQYHSLREHRFALVVTGILPCRGLEKHKTPAVGGA